MGILQSSDFIQNYNDSGIVKDLGASEMPHDGDSRYLHDTKIYMHFVDADGNILKTGTTVVEGYLNQEFAFNFAEEYRWYLLDLDEAKKNGLKLGIYMAVDEQASSEPPNSINITGKYIRSRVTGKYQLIGRFNRYDNINGVYVQSPTGDHIRLSEDPKEKESQLYEPLGESRLKYVQYKESNCGEGEGFKFPNGYKEFRQGFGYADNHVESNMVRSSSVSLPFTLQYTPVNCNVAGFEGLMVITDDMRYSKVDNDYIENPVGDYVRLGPDEYHSLSNFSLPFTGTLDIEKKPNDYYRCFVTERAVFSLSNGQTFPAYNPVIIDGKTYILFSGSDPDLFTFMSYYYGPYIDNFPLFPAYHRAIAWIRKASDGGRMTCFVDENYMTESTVVMQSANGFRPSVFDDKVSHRDEETTGVEYFYNAAGYYTKPFTTSYVCIHERVVEPMAECSYLVCYTDYPTVAFNETARVHNNVGVPGFDSGKYFEGIYAAGYDVTTMSTKYDKKLDENGNPIFDWQLHTWSSDDNQPELITFPICPGYEYVVCCITGGIYWRHLPTDTLSAEPIIVLPELQYMKQDIDTHIKHTDRFSHLTYIGNNTFIALLQFGKNGTKKLCRIDLGKMDQNDSFTINQIMLCSAASEYRRTGKWNSDNYYEQKRQNKYVADLFALEGFELKTINSNKNNGGGSNG